MAALERLVAHVFQLGGDFEYLGPFHVLALVIWIILIRISRRIWDFLSRLVVFLALQLAAIRNDHVLLWLVV